MQFNLVPHPATSPAKPAFNLWASVDHAASLGSVATTNIWFGIGAPAERFVIPELSEPWRACTDILADLAGEVCPDLNAACGFFRVRQW